MVKESYLRSSIADEVRRHYAACVSYVDHKWEN